MNNVLDSDHSTVPFWLSRFSGYFSRIRAPVTTWEWQFGSRYGPVSCMLWLPRVWTQAQPIHFVWYWCWYGVAERSLWKGEGWEGIRVMGWESGGGGGGVGRWRGSAVCCEWCVQCTVWNCVCVGGCLECGTLICVCVDKCNAPYCFHPHMVHDMRTKVYEGEARRALECWWWAADRVVCLSVDNSPTILVRPGWPGFLESLILCWC